MMFRYLGHKMYVHDDLDVELLITEGNVFEGEASYIGEDLVKLELIKAGPWDNLVFTLPTERFGELWEEVNG